MTQPDAETILRDVEALQSYCAGQPFNESNYVSIAIEHFPALLRALVKITAEGGPTGRDNMGQWCEYCGQSHSETPTDHAEDCELRMGLEALASLRADLGAQR